MTLFGLLYIFAWKKHYDRESLYALLEKLFSRSFIAPKTNIGTLDLGISKFEFLIPSSFWISKFLTPPVWLSASLRHGFQGFIPSKCLLVCCRLCFRVSFSYYHPTNICLHGCCKCAAGIKSGNRFCHFMLFAPQFLSLSHLLSLFLLSCSLWNIQNKW